MPIRSKKGVIGSYRPPVRAGSKMPIPFCAASVETMCRDDVHIVSTTWHIQNAQNKYRVKYNS